MSKDITPQYFLELALRRKWLLILPTVACFLLSILIFTTLPKFYQSSSLILVHPSELSREFVRGIVEYDVSNDLQNIEEQVYSRNWMERVVHNLDLAPESGEGPEFDSQIKLMLNRVNVETRGRASFTITYSGKDPQTVHSVVQGLTDMFIEENVAQMAKADADAAFNLDEEIRTVEQELGTKESSLAAYKQRHMGELPEQIEPNQRMLERLQMQQQLNGENLRDARNRHLILESQLQGLGDTGQGMGDPLVNDLLEARQALEDLRQRYTENHPDVINARARIEVLETQLENRTTSGDEGDAAEGEPLVSQMSTYNLALRSELDNVKMTIQRLEEEELRLRQEIGRYENRVEAAFNRQQELTQLTRDYDNLEEYFRTLLDMKLNTRLSSRVLQAHGANQYEVLDPPRVPRNPYKPDPLIVLFCGIGCGLAIGCTLIAGLELRKDAFFGADALEKSMVFPVLATIPMLQDEASQGQRKRRMIVIVSAVCLAVLVLCCVNLFLVDLVSILRNFLNSVIQ